MGLIPKDLPLEKAAQAVGAMILSGERKTRGKRSSAPAKVHDLEASVSPAEGTSNGSPKQDIEDFRATVEEVVSKALSANPDRAATQEMASMQQQLVKAVNQLDHARRVLLEQAANAKDRISPGQDRDGWQASPQASASSPIDLVEWHRLAARVARIEAKLDEILQKQAQ